MDRPNMNKSDEDLLFDILSRLPAKTLIRFMSVSRSWFHLISKDSCFIHHHLRFQRASTDALLFLPSLTESRIRNAPVHYLSLGTSERRQIRPPWSRPWLRRRMKVYNSYSDLSIAGHCNGLVCVSDAHRLIIWNPAIRRFKILPETDDFSLQLQSKNIYGRQSEVQTVIGFGFVGNLESCYYKVVRMTYTNEDASMSRPDHPTIGEVFDSRTDSWRRVADEDVQRLSITRRASNGAFVGESLYWLGERSKTLEEEEEASGSDIPYYYPKLTAMSLVDGRTRSVELPGEFDMEIDSGKGVAALGESKLGLFAGDYRHRLLVTVWATEVDQVCWVKLFRVNLQAEPLCFSGNGEVVMRMRHRNLVLFDPEVCDPCHFEELGFDIADHVVGYAESLLLLDGERGEEEEPNNAEETEVEEEDSFEGCFDLFD